MADADAVKDANRISYDAKKYEEWETMHDGTIYFDTAACEAGKMIGDANKVSINPSSWTANNGQWWYDIT